MTIATLSRSATRLTLAASVLALSSAAAFAAPAIALVGDKTLVMVDTETLEVSGMMDVEGVDRLHGIDVRPADNMLYGVSADGRVVTIDTASGAATDKSTLSETLADGVGAMVDFNPAADRLRIMGTDGTNHRANVDDGAVTVDGSLKFDPAGPNASDTQMVVATAYINSYGKPEATKMYDIDTAMGLLQQTAPNDGTLAVIGNGEGWGAESYAFDVQTTSDGTNTAWLVADNVVHTLNLETGEATEIGALEGIDGMIRDIAILPAM
jgi:hypothetical protein